MNVFKAKIQNLLRMILIIDNMRSVGYGRRNTTEVIHMEQLDDEGKRAHVKKLWMADPEKYYEWKNRCIELESLPDFFGTADNPIPIDESKL